MGGDILPLNAGNLQQAVTRAYLFIPSCFDEIEQAIIQGKIWEQRRVPCPNTSISVNPVKRNSPPF